MKRFFVSMTLIILLAGVGYGGGAYWLGMRTETHCQQMLLGIPQSPYFSISTATYNRGIFKSHAVTVIEFNLPRQNNKQNSAPMPTSFRLNLSHNIWHGPLPFEKLPDGTFHLTPILAFIETTMTVPTNTLPNIPELTDIVKRFSLTDYTTIYLNGSGTSSSKMTAWEKHIGKDTGQIKIKWQGLTSHSRFTADLKGIHGTTTLPGLAITSDNGMFVFKNLAVKMDTDSGKSGFSVGDAKVSLAQISFADESKKNTTNFEMDGLAITGNTKENGNTLNHTQTARINHILLNNMRHGPFLYELEIRNLDTASLLKLQQKIELMQLQVMNNPGQGADPQLLAEISQLIPDLVKKGLELELKKLSIDTRDGNFTARFKISFASEAAAGITNPIMLLSALKIDADASASEYLLTKTMKGITKGEIRKKNAAAGKIVNNFELDRMASRECRAQLAALQTRGLISRNQDRFKATISYRDGTFKINEVAFPLQSLLQMAVQ
jgi:uncharacterized protein YdgA (DUF945 family)